MIAIIISPGTHSCAIVECREVEDFARRLNSDWPERMQILSLGQERKLVPTSNGNGSLHRYSSTFLLSPPFPATNIEMNFHSSMICVLFYFKS